METVNDAKAPADPPPYKQPGSRLTRATDDKVLSGLSGGLGRYLGIDPVVFRIAFVVLTLAGGSGILLYLVGWLMIPDDAGGTLLHRFGGERSTKLIAAVLAGIGLVVLLDNVTGRNGDIPVGLVLIGIGGLFLWSRRNHDDLHSGPPAPPAPPAPPTPPAFPPGDTRPVPAGDTATFPSVGAREEAAGSEPAPFAPDAAPPAAPGTPAEPKARSVIVPVTLSLLAVLAGGLVMFRVSPTTGFALALLVTGGGLLVGAWRGRAKWLIPVGLALSVALAAASVIDVPVRGGGGNVVFHPLTLEEIATPYRLAAGDLLIDLRDLDLRGGTVTVVASVAAGHVHIIVPDGATVDVDAHVGAGNLLLLGRQSDGVDIRRQVTESGGEGGGRLILRAQAGVGMVEVQRAFA